MRARLSAVPRVVVQWRPSIRLLLAGMLLRSAKCRNGLHRKIFCISPGSAAVRRSARRCGPLWPKWGSAAVRDSAKALRHRCVSLGMDGRHRRQMLHDVTARTRADVQAATSAAVHPARVATSARDAGDGCRRHFAEERSRITQSTKLTPNVSTRSTTKHLQQQHRDHHSSIHRLTHHRADSDKLLDR